jgi:hypothetical protein
VVCSGAVMRDLRARFNRGEHEVDNVVPASAPSAQAIQPLSKDMLLGAIARAPLQHAGSHNAFLPNPRTKMSVSCSTDTS